MSRAREILRKVYRQGFDGVGGKGQHYQNKYLQKTLSNLKKLIMDELPKKKKHRLSGISFKCDYNKVLTETKKIIERIFE